MEWVGALWPIDRTNPREDRLKRLGFSFLLLWTLGVPSRICLQLFTIECDDISWFSLSFLLFYFFFSTRQKNVRILRVHPVRQKTCTHINFNIYKCTKFLIFKNLSNFLIEKNVKFVWPLINFKTGKILMMKKKIQLYLHMIK